MTTAQDQQSRAKFEALAESLGYDTTDLGHGFCHADTRKAQKVWQAARAMPADMELVAGQCRFVGDLEWRPCAVEHVRLVLATPQEWDGYEVRYLYAEAPRSLAAQERYRLLVRGVDTIQAGDEFLQDDAVTWQPDPNGIFVGMTYVGNVLLPARRAIEPAP